MTNSSPITVVPADASLLCPYTLKPISSIDKSELAVINPEQSECGHHCSLPHLVSHLHDAHAGSSHSCPVCLQFKVAVICDGYADKVLRGRQGENDMHEQKIICFRYGAIQYYLSLKSTSSSISATSCALPRIEMALGVDVKHGMKIIHKGKVIYPNTNIDLTQELLSISSLDIAKKRKKPSLVVMGMRKRQMYSKGTNSTAVVGVRAIVFAIFRMLTPRSLWWGFLWTINTTKSLLGGVCIFLHSMLYPPQHRED